MATHMLVYLKFVILRNAKYAQLNDKSIPKWLYCLKKHTEILNWLTVKDSVAYIGR